MKTNAMETNAGEANVPSELASTLHQRRQRLAELFDAPAILWSGSRPTRNFPANRYLFRASSHFLYFAGLGVEQAAVRLEAGRMELFADDPHPASTLWHGEQPGREELAGQIGADAAFPLADLKQKGAGAATLPGLDPWSQQQQRGVLGRSPVLPLQGKDLALAKAVSALRLSHDPFAIAQIERAVAVTVAAHEAAMRATREATCEAEVRSHLERVFLAHNATCAYNSIVTVRGDILHSETYDNPLRSGDLLLVDAGAETPLGWGSDVTRTWPANGTFSPEQKDIYNVVLAARDAGIEKVAPGVEYREIHLTAARVLAEGLVALGILRGDPETLVDRDAHALFFPHGVGHLLGLDVHDMEDLGDLAGYGEGRCRSDRFGLCYLRLDRPLQAGNAVTIEPGFYLVPSILNDRANREKYARAVNWERLERFAGARGIRIEDDVLVTENGHRVLTSALPAEAAAIEMLVGA